MVHTQQLNWIFITFDYDISTCYRWIERWIYCCSAYSIQQLISNWLFFIRFKYDVIFESNIWWFPIILDGNSNKPLWCLRALSGKSFKIVAYYHFTCSWRNIGRKVFLRHCEITKLNVVHYSCGSDIKEKAGSKSYLYYTESYLYP